MRSGPHQRNIGLREPSTVETIVRRLMGHSSTGPSGVLDQSNARHLAAISPDPTNTGCSAEVASRPPSRPDRAVFALPIALILLCGTRGRCTTQRLSHHPDRLAARASFG